MSDKQPLESEVERLGALVSAFARAQLTVHTLIDRAPVKITVYGWPDIQVRRDGDVILVQAPHELAVAALDAWYESVADASRARRIGLADAWEACRAAVRGESVTIEQLIVLLSLAGDKGK